MDNRIEEAMAARRGRPIVSKIIDASLIDMSKVTGADVEAAKIGIEVVIRHVSSHADFRGKIMQLDKECTICQNYFADELAKL